MKKKAIPPFTLTAGQSGRLLFNFTLPDGADTPALRGALMVHNERVDMENTQADMLTIPSLPAGVYLTEVRAAGVCVLYGHVEVLPSPLFGEEGLASYRVDIDNTEDVLQVNITMLEGMPGPQGEQGPKGDTGAPGAAGPKGEKGDPMRYADLTDAQRLELVEPLVYKTATESPDVTTEDNYKAYGFGCVMERGGKVEALTLQSRANGQSTPTGTLVWVKVWRGATQQLIAVSENSQPYAEDAALYYTFAVPFDVAEGEELRVSYHTEGGLDTAAYQMGVECRVRVTAKETTKPGGMLGDQGGYGAEGSTAQRSWVPLYIWQMQVERFAPAEHAEDAVMHLTAEERAGLAELLANKEALLALLA